MVGTGRLRVRSTLRALGALRDALYPPRCLACRGTAWDAPLAGLCARCAGALDVLVAPCRRCGREAGASPPSGRDPAPCARCREEPSDLDGVVAALRYRDRARDLLLALKFGGRLPAAVPLGLLLADAVLDADRPGDLLVPVPLSRARFRRRGHNQADEIARVVAARTGIERDPRALARRLHGPPQSTRPRGERARGPRGGFRARRGRVEGRCVLLVDDVVTTGATASACARALRRAGALRVVLAAACRA